MRPIPIIVPAWLALFLTSATAAPPYYPDAHRAYEEHWRAHPEHADEMVRLWHQRLFHREIAPPLLARWTEELRRGIDAPLALAHMLGSPEYYGNCGNSPERFIRTTFAEIVGRPPEPNEYRFWFERLLHSDRGVVAQELVSRYPPAWIAEAPVVAPAPAYEYRTPVYRYR